LAGIRFEDVTKVYDDGTRAVSGLDLDVAEGEFVVLVGPSGCGKTTALRMVAGLEDVSEGVITIDDRVVNHVPARDPDIAMVFQSYALYPQLSVYDNIAFGLRLHKLKKDEIDRRVQDAARVLGLEQLAEAQATRALRRPAAARRDGPRDRPPAAGVPDGRALSNLDAKLRVQLRAEVSSLVRDLGTTTIYVTHDQVEAMTLGDRVAVMRKGELQQVATPQELYDRPVNLFVGGFIGSPAMNMVESTLERPERHREGLARGLDRGQPPARRRQRRLFAPAEVGGSAWPLTKALAVLGVATVVTRRTLACQQIEAG
jgi:multiple sugar transport system ATP-binding protein